MTTSARQLHFPSAIDVYDMRETSDGRWMIYNVVEGKPLIVDGMPLVVSYWGDADDLVNALNGQPIHQSSAPSH